MKEIQFVFFKGISMISEVIKKVTGSEFSHVAYYNKYDDLLIECWAADELSIVDFISFHPIDKLNKKFCWKYSDFINHEPNTPYEILSKDVPDSLFNVINGCFRFIAEYNIPYDIIGLLGRLNKKLNLKYGMYCSEGCQNILRFAQKLYNEKVVDNELITLTNDVPGYKTDPGKLYYILKAYGWKSVKTART